MQEKGVKTMPRPYLGDPKYTIEVLQKYNFAFQKRFGQNFLIDTHVLDKIIDSAQITKDDFVLERSTWLKQPGKLRQSRLIRH
jgi:16S rRNA (adenine1518-N6/adenine1519-N6)-dimethyltransferase